MEGEYKPGAKCRYYDACILYNMDALKHETEVEMCGKGQPIDKNYVPQVPEPEELKPTETGEIDGNCNAFDYQRLASLTAGDISDHLTNIIKDMKREGVWGGVVNH